MAQDVVSEQTNRPLFSRRWIGAASLDPEPALAKWPRRWRYAFVVGTPLVFWAGIFAAFHWG